MSILDPMFPFEVISRGRRALCATAVCATWALGAAPVLAQLRVEITGVGANQFPIAVANFAGDSQSPVDIAKIIRDDLARSGAFRTVDAGAAPVADSAAPDLAAWKSRGADALVIGSVNRLADGRFDVRFRLFDAVKQAQLDGLSYVAPAADLRLTAHRIADRIYEKLTGIPGVFATRIAYVVQHSHNSYELAVADSDGANAQTALKSREPIISPTWSPDGGRLAYVSFESRKPVVYVHQLASGRRHVVANFKGNNSAPAFSPDGARLAVALTRDGLTQVYLINADGSGVRRFTQSSGIDTEPVFSPDGKYVYFTSDRGGNPQIYRQPLEGGAAQRVTFGSEYAISPDISRDGKQLAFIARRGGRFQAMVMDLASGQETPVTDTAKDESPSFAPNGKLLLYATEVGGRGVLGTVSADGRVRTRLTGPSGDIREPTWGPHVK
ncbi:MAG: Tol-Pal system beta propeller repeat protein TolB [Burkholderiaceae bacterium]